MNIDTILKKLYQEVPGVELLAMIGLDGVPVLSEGSQDMHQLLKGEELMHVVDLIKVILKKSNEIDVGVFERCLIETKEHDFFFQVINYEYFLLFVLSKKSNIGKARYLLKKWTPEMLKDI